MGNYLEMRHHTGPLPNPVERFSSPSQPSHPGSTLFLLRKKLEGVLNYAFPTWWIPLYKMVTFTRIPYHLVIEKEKQQAAILDKTAKVMGILSAGACLFMARTLIRSSL